MAKIKIAELDINTDALIKATADVKKEIDSLKKAQKDLTKNGETSSKQFVQNSADIKTLNKAYNDNIKALSENTKATADQANRTELLSIALSSEATSIKEAREQNKLLNKLRNETNATTAEGQEEIKRLNNALDANNEFIKENADAYTQQKINVGNYKDSITEALGELNLFNGGIGGFISRSQEAGGAGNLLGQSLKSAVSGIIGMTKASLAFIATPVGAVVAAIAAGFLLVKNALDRSEASTNKINKAFSGLTGIFKGVLKALEPIGEFLIDVLVTNIELAEQAFFDTANAIASVLNTLGFEDASKSISGFTTELKESSEAAKALEQAEQDLASAQRIAQKLQLDFQKDAEKLRQIRDDETKSFAERQKANEQLGAVLKKQQEEELAIALKALEVADLRLGVEGETTEALDERAEALTTISDIQERISGQESEQLTNRVSLQKEANDKAIEQQKGALDLFIAQQGIRAKSLEEEVNIAAQVSQKKIDILKAELANRKITQSQFDAGVIAAQNELLAAQTNATISNFEREVSAYEGLNSEKLNSDRLFSEETLNLEEERLNGLAQKRRDFEALRLQEGVINQQQYNDAINAIDEENRIAKDAAKLEREEAEKERLAIDLENKQALESEDFFTQLELEQERNDIKLAQELANAEKTGADQKLIKEKYAEFDKDIEKRKQDAKLELASNALGNITAIFGKESAVGKAAAIAQTTIDTYKSATAAYSSLAGIPIVGPALGALAAGAAVAAGIANVKKITSTKAPKAEQGGMFEIGGKRHSAGGTMFRGDDGTVLEAEKGELIGVLNRNAAAQFMDFNNSYPAGKSTPTFMQGGGIITQGVKTDGIDLEQLAEITAAAVSNVPPPIVSVEDINAGQTRTAEVINGADL